MAKWTRNVAFLLLVGAAVYAKTAPVKAFNESCISSQPNCCGVLEADAFQYCGGAYYWGGCCENCGWDGDHCCAEWACVG
jgi:hypothetical protein